MNIHQYMIEAFEIRTAVLQLKSKTSPILIDTGYVHTAQKTYWMPALKILEVRADRYFSPCLGFEWKNNELKAHCDKSAASLFATYGNRTHDAPYEGCSCGIYASTSLAVLAPYAYDLDYVLCIIEPFPNTKVIQGEDGWRCGHAFISETLTGLDASMSPEDGAAILSIAWNIPFPIKDFINILQKTDKILKKIQDELTPSKENTRK